MSEEEKGWVAWCSVWGEEYFGNIKILTVDYKLSTPGFSEACLPKCPHQFTGE
jgi:hypothetical protein